MQPSLISRFGAAVDIPPYFVYSILQTSVEIVWIIQEWLHAYRPFVSGRKKKAGGETEIFRTPLPASVNQDYVEGF